MLKRLLTVSAIAAFSFVAYVQADDQVQNQNANPTTETLLFEETDGDEAPEAALACCKDCRHEEEVEATTDEEAVKQQVKLACDEAAGCSIKVVAPTDALKVEEQQLEEQTNKETALAGCKNCHKKKRVIAHHGKGDDHHFFA